MNVTWHRGAKLTLPKRPPAAAIAAFRTPTLVVVAGRSRQNTPKRLEQLAHRLPDVRVVTLPRATHFTLPQEYPVEIGAAIIDLVNDREERPATPVDGDGRRDAAAKQRQA
jgi:pimeloyl-ACP methyl ester carboxylesterase